MSEPITRAAVIVAHPDDEVLWAGGLILQHPEWDWTIVTLCRANDPDRAPRFDAVLERLAATGVMADLDDGPEQTPIDRVVIEETILSLLPETAFDLVVTHGPHGEYTRHRRHEELSRAVLHLWQTGRLRADALWMFAYEDGGRAYLPRARADAHRVNPLGDAVRRNKYDLITATYGFAADSWEARATPRVEAFWCFDSPEAAEAWFTRHGIET